LQHCTQQVRINDILSDSVVIISGVPQGSVLGPTLFLMNINDLIDGFATLDCSINLYADDAKLNNSFKVGDYVPALDEALEYITKWAGIFQLQIANCNHVLHTESLWLHQLAPTTTE